MTRGLFAAAVLLGGCAVCDPPNTTSLETRTIGCMAAEALAAEADPGGKIAPEACATDCGSSSEPNARLLSCTLGQLCVDPEGQVVLSCEWEVAGEDEC